MAFLLETDSMSLEGADEYAKHSIYQDPIMRVVNTCGINYVELYKKLIDELK